jgi:uncharacterized protein (DUF1810 family)
LIECKLALLPKEFMMREERDRDTGTENDPFDLRRFTSAQEGAYEQALTELRRGQKRSHWMWFIFPQIDGLGSSATSKHFAIKSLEEADAYLRHPVLGPRLLECAEAVLAVEGRAISHIFGSPDDLKLRSSMTLFSYTAEPESVFIGLLEKYFNGEKDVTTLRIVEKLREETRKG